MGARDWVHFSDMITSKGECCACIQNNFLYVFGGELRSCEMQLQYERSSITTPGFELITLKRPPAIANFVHIVMAIPVRIDCKEQILLLNQINFEKTELLLLLDGKDLKKGISS